jgi:hypothetical protein
MSIFNLVGCLVFIEITGQVNRAGVSTNIPEWGRKSPQRIRQIFNLHRELYPTSRIRLTAATLMCSALAAFLLVLILLFSNAPHIGSASAPQTIQSPR